MRTFGNPVLPGSHPDPSICRVGDDYYLATSTFALFPGIALHHSRDLVHWRPIGHALDRPSQLNLDGVAMTDGIYAPTLRHHGGQFVLVCTVVDNRAEGAVRTGNFVVTATDPAGRWSDPVWIDDAPGFDPSLHFDDDGVVWCCGTFQHDPDGAPGRTTVWLQQIDPTTWQLTGGRHHLWTGAEPDARWAEGPHLYRIDGSCYLLAAEGGTDASHAVVVACSPEITGPYESCPANPVLTARHLGTDARVVGPGHADLVQTADGEWWAVLLGARPSDAGWWGTSRETFLVPVQWQDGWPVLGDVQAERLPAPAMPEQRWPTSPACQRFDAVGLDPEWQLVRTPRERWWSTGADGLTLACRPATAYDRSNPSLLLRRVEQADWHAATDVALTDATTDARAGLVVWVSDTDQLRLESDGTTVRVVRREHDVDDVVAEWRVGNGAVRLGVEAHARTLVARAGLQGDPWRHEVSLDIGFLGQQVNGYFFGLLVGPYATAPDGRGSARFGWFEYADR